MARPRSFDEHVVLRGATDAFRRVGFAAVSIKDLEEATGLSAGSIYNSFGDKSGLFDAGFAYYLKAVLKHRIATYADAAEGLSGVRKLFVTLLNEPRGGRYGCLITNSAIEFGVTDDKRQAAVLEGFEILRAALYERLVAARAARALREDIEPTSVAVKLVALYQGVLVLMRSGYNARRLRLAIDAEFDSLERFIKGSSKTQKEKIVQISTITRKA